MRKIHAAAGASLGVVALMASSLAASAAPVDDTDASSTAQAAQTEGGEFVVAYEGDAATATEAVRSAGGTVVDVNEAVGIALVEAPDGALRGRGRGHRRRHRRRPQPLGGHRPARVSSTASSRSGRRPRSAPPTAPAPPRPRTAGGRDGAEPFADRQWDMAQMNVSDAHRRATGRGVTVGIIDTGVDASHPDLAPNFDAALSRNFTMDIPAIDGACEVPTCIDPAERRRGRPRHATSPASSPPRATASASAGVAPTPPSSTCGPARTRATSSSTRRWPRSPTRPTPGSTS